MLQLFVIQQVTAKTLEVTTQVNNQNYSSKTKLTLRETAQILPLSSRLMCNKAHFEHKFVSGRAPIYLSTKSLINQSSRNSSRKLNVPIPRIDLFKSSLVYSGPALWNSLPSALRLPDSPSVFKKSFIIMLSFLGERCSLLTQQRELWRKFFINSLQRALQSKNEKYIYILKMQIGDSRKLHNIQYTKHDSCAMAESSLVYSGRFYI